MMIDLLTFFERNAILILFLYGLVFFILGLVVALQSWRHTRLELARSLRWLAAFGLIHGIHEWGAVFIPLQGAYISDAWLAFLLFFQILTLAISYTCLFQFGSDLFRSEWSKIIYVPIVIFAIWFFVFFLLPLVWDSATSHLGHNHASIWARYLLGFPGALLTAFGLRHQANRQIKPLNLPQIYHMLQVAGLAMGAYAIFSGLIVSPSDFFPANWLNSANLTKWLGVPAPVFRSLIGLVIVISIIRALEVFNVEIDYQIERMEVTNSLLAERERIGKALHDGAIQQVYTAGLLVESVQKRLEPNGVEGQRLNYAMEALNEAIADLRAYMGDLRRSPATTDLAEGLRQKVDDATLLALMQVELQFDISEAKQFMPLQVTRILAIVGEALANIARHSQAKRVLVWARSEDDCFVISVKDDGVGFTMDVNGHGYGLRDMRDQARLLGGQLLIETQAGQGTEIILSVPWKGSGI